MHLLRFTSTFPLLLAMICPAAFAQSDEECLGVGKFAQAAADLLHLGKSEDEVLSVMFDPARAEPKRPKARQKMLDERDIAVVNWVYTVRPSAQDARAVVYVKCMSGGLGHIDMSKYKAAGKSKPR
ncbi:MAG: hypothetical protein ACXWC4_00760 [Telluria sp.]